MTRGVGFFGPVLNLIPEMGQPNQVLCYYSLFQQLSTLLLGYQHGRQLLFAFVEHCVYS